MVSFVCVWVGGWVWVWVGQDRDVVCVLWVGGWAVVCLSCAWVGGCVGGLCAGQ